MGTQLLLGLAPLETLPLWSVVVWDAQEPPSHGDVWPCLDTFLLPELLGGWGGGEVPAAVRDVAKHCGVPRTAPK